MYADVECGIQLDPPEPVGEPWPVRLPTTLVMLQDGDELPEFPAEGGAPPTELPDEPVPDGSTPF